MYSQVIKVEFEGLTQETLLADVASVCPGGFSPPNENVNGRFESLIFYTFAYMSPWLWLEVGVPHNGLNDYGYSVVCVAAWSGAFPAMGELGP